MRYRVAAVFGVLGLAAGLAFAAASGRPAPTARGLAGSLSRLPDGGFLFDATITELASGEVVARPQLRFANGDTAAVSIDAGGRILELKVSADDARDAATVDLAEIQGGDRVTLSRLDLKLR